MIKKLLVLPTLFLSTLAWGAYSPSEIQYTEGDTDASITGTAIMVEGAGDTLVAAPGTAADGLLVNLGANNDVTVTGTVTANLAAGTNNIGDVDVLSIAAGDNNIGNVDVVTMPTVTVTDGAGALNTIIDSGTLTSITNAVTVTDGAGALNVIVDSGTTAVTNAGTFVTQENGALLTSSQLIDDTVFTDDTSTHSTGTTKVLGIGAVATPTDAAVNANDIGMPGMTLNRELWTSLTTALPAGTNNIGDVDVLTMPTTTVTATNLDVQIGGSDTVTVTDGAGAMNVIVDSGTTAVTQATATNLKTQIFGDDTTQAIDTDVAGQLQVDVLTMPTTTVTATNLDVQIGGSDSLTIGTFPDNEPFNIAQMNGTAVTMGNGVSGTGVQRVTMASDSTGTLAGVTTVTTLTNLTGGTTAHDGGGGSINPVAIGGYASDAVPTEVNADADIVRKWLLRTGATVIAAPPHLGLDGNGYTLLSETAQYTTTQTGTALVTPTAGKRLVVTKAQIQAGGTTAGTFQLWFEGSNGDTTYTRGTDYAIFDGEFAPSSTLKPGVVMDGPWIGSTADFDLRVTDSAAINPLTVTVWYYEI